MKLAVKLAVKLANVLRIAKVCKLLGGVVTFVGSVGKIAEGVGCVGKNIERLEKVENIEKMWKHGTVVNVGKLG